MGIHIEEVEPSGSIVKRIWLNLRCAKQQSGPAVDVDMNTGDISTDKFNLHEAGLDETKLRITMLQKAVEISEGVTQ